MLGLKFIHVSKWSPWQQKRSVYQKLLIISMLIIPIVYHMYHLMGTTIYCLFCITHSMPIFVMIAWFTLEQASTVLVPVTQPCTIWHDAFLLIDLQLLELDTVKVTSYKTNIYSHNSYPDTLRASLSIDLIKYKLAMPRTQHGALFQGPSVII